MNTNDLGLMEVTDAGMKWVAIAIVGVALCTALGTAVTSYSDNCVEIERLKLAQLQYSAAR